MYPIDQGEVAQRVVCYLGPRHGTFHIRGRPSGRNYGFDAGEPCRWVLEEDIPRFRSLIYEFAVDDSQVINPEARRLEEKIARLVEERMEHAIAVPSPPVARRRVGRPPVPFEELERIVHLRHHTTTKWTFAQISTVVDTGEASDPAAALRQRYSRAIRNLPFDRCSLCDDQDDPPPPSNEEENEP